MPISRTSPSFGILSRLGVCLVIYSFPITVLTTHTKTVPSETTLKLTHGIIHRVVVEFPAGCRGLVHCTLWYQEHQIIPLNSDSSLSGDTFPVDFEEYLEMTQGPFVVKARC